jgi:hypothetical protein
MAVGARAQNDAERYVAGAVAFTQCGGGTISMIEEIRLWGLMSRDSRTGQTIAGASAQLAAARAGAGADCAATAIQADAAWFMVEVLPQLQSSTLGR